MVPPSRLCFTDGSHLFFVVFRKMVSFVSDSTVGTKKKTGMAAAFDDERTNRQANFFKEKRNSQELFGENYIHMLKSKVFEELLGMI